MAEKCDYNIWLYNQNWLRTGANGCEEKLDWEVISLNPSDGVLFFSKVYKTFWFMLYWFLICYSLPFYSLLSYFQQLKVEHVLHKIWQMTGLKPLTSGSGSNNSANWTTTTTLWSCTVWIRSCGNLFLPKALNIC